MSKKYWGWYIAGGIGVTILTAILLPNIVAGLVFAAFIVAPVVGYFLLDPSQRKRLRRINRKQIGS